VELAKNAQTVLADDPFPGCDCSAVLRGTPKANINGEIQASLLEP